jgi:hypothetical protein
MAQDEIVEVRPGLTRVTSRTGEGDRHYIWNRTIYPSVTTIIGNATSKPYLQRWAAKEAALAALANVDALAALQGQPIEYADDRRPKTPAARELYDLMASASERDRDSAADIGSRVHDIAEAYALGVDFPINPASDLAPFLATLKRWFDDFQPVILAAEAPVVSERYGYAGTMDLAAGFTDLGGRRLLLDYKSGKSISSDVALQLAGLRYADFMVLPDGTTAPVPEVDGCAVVHIRPNGYRMYEVKADEETFMSFRYAQAMHRWATDTSKGFKLAEIKAQEVA